MKTELRKIFETAESEDRGLSAREIAAVINSVPAEERMARTEILAAVNGAGGSDSPETREAIAETLRYMEMRAVDAIEERAIRDRENEVRALAVRYGDALTPGSAPDRDEREEWRSLVPSLSEYRAISGGVASEGGYTVPSEVSGKYIDALKVKSTFLRGLPAQNFIPFTSATFSVPQLVSSTGADYVAEGGMIPEGQMVWGEVKFEAKKIGEIQWASSEVLEDSAVDQRRVIADNLLRDASLKFDADAFTGATTNPIKGVLSQGVSTALGAGKTAVTYDDLADAVARIEATNGTPSVVWASVDMAAALRKEKAAGSGVYQAGSPTDSPASTAWGLPILPSAFLPARTVIVCDASRVIVGVRRNATVRISEDARFDKDQVGFKLTMRMAGVSVAEPSSVQIIKAANS
ncbi:phage major capsid protein [Streptomyces sp. SID4946]|uniref:phage major capsid protein n=1 Tax=Streptomyces sp. LamerLS-31b TaxID=1839765 RepID=UPI00081E57C9|nr:MULTISPECIES: phage major capsid protein [unclassified Streptomyces]MYQ90740.1 phage major capsid protein [Streptomyces sp. SID4946]SCF62479.1 phage major capsid protein, HK97 family [Streptomyces sp. DconLS]SCF66246.1 phage major capsid protein, HK97 family [Streptomyces sp. LamerLS-31b]